MTKLKGTNISTGIVPYDSNDLYATHYAKYGKGGWHSVETLAERDAIPADRLEPYMACMVKATKTLYILDETLTWYDYSAESSEALAEEIAARIAADEQLQDNIDAETTRATNAETTLQSNIDDEETRAKAAEATLTTNLNSEITRATNAENTLDDKIEAETTRASSAESTLTTNLNAEITRATTSESNLSTAISNEVTRATTAEGDLDDKIEAETTRATNAEDALDDKIEAETTRATGAESDLDDKIEAETSRAEGVEGTLSNLTTDAQSNLVSAINEVDSHADTNASNLSSEIARAEGVEGDLSNLTTDSKSNLVSAVNEVDSHADTNATNIGILSNLTTDAQSNLVSAINEVDSHADTNASNLADEITRATGVEGSLSSLTTDTKSNLVAAINEVDSHADTNASNLANEIARAEGVEGDLTDLTTDAQSNLVAAINEVDSHADTNATNIGTLSSLTTDDQSDLVSAINEVDSHADTNASNLASEITRATGVEGTLSSLTTDSKTNLVSAINEVDSHADTNATNIGTLSSLTTDSKTNLVSAINEVDSHTDTNTSNIGTLSNLTTTEKSTLVGAINEVDSHADTNATNIGTLSNLTTDAQSNLVAAINEVDSHSDTNASDISTINSKISTSASSSNKLTDTQYVDDADNALQQQIDAISASADVADIVGTYADLVNYDTSTLTNNDIIKVLNDEEHDHETTYYKWIITGGVGAFDLIGEEGPYYTVAAADATFATIVNLDAEVTRAEGVEGTLSSLTTTDKSDLVSAINEVDSHADTTASGLATHIADTSNPHSVTAAQVGLGNVDNTADLDKPISTATQTALDGKVSDVKVGNTSVVSNMIAALGTMAGETAADYSTKAVADTLYADIAYEATIDNHIADTSNPHSVTKAQVGLGNVDNTSDLDKPISTATQTALNLKADESDLTAHTSDISNPHSVTASQVGLGNVDNTSDLNKPISTATQTALNTKVDKVSTASKVYGTDASGDQTTYDVTSFGAVDDVTVGGTSVVSNKIAALGSMAGETASDYSTKAVADTLYADISYESTIDNHIADTSNPHSVTASQVGLGNVDNTSDLNKPISTATQTALDGKVAKVSTANVVYGTDSNGDPAYLPVTSFGAVNDVTVGGTSVVNSNKIAVLGSMAGETASDYQTKLSSTNKLSVSYVDGLSSVATSGAYSDLSGTPTNLSDFTDDITTSTYSSSGTDPVNGTAVASALSSYVPTSRTVNGKALSSDISLDASDVGALPSSTVIPTVNDATLTIQKNGTTIETFTANSSTNVTANISVPTKVSDLTNDSGFISGITSSDVTTALGYTPYSDSNPSGYQANVIETVKVNGTALTPSNKAVDVTVPTVNNATLTIKQGTTTKGTFTANADTDVVITLDSGGGGGSVDIDNKSITTNSSDEIQSIGNMNRNVATGATEVKYDWIGTYEEYVDQEVETAHPEWVCYITDDDESSSASRCVGEIVTSTIPLNDAGLHLLNGALINGSGSYAKFVNYVAGLVTDYPDLFVNENDWQSAVTSYGVCGKFVYDSVNNTVRLPKITGFVEGTTDVTALGDLVEAGLPNITGKIDLVDRAVGGASSGAFYSTNISNRWASWNLESVNTGALNHILDASRSSSIYGNSSTVQPQAIKVLYYIVIANSVTNELNLDVADMATKSLDNLDSVGKNIANWSNNVTNCITEIPQDIKLELNNGTLTLKAGSKVYVPNGAGVFKEISINTDLTANKYTSVTPRFLFISFNNNYIPVDLYASGIDNCYSGNTTAMNSTTPANYKRFYNTETNKIYWGGASGNTWVETTSSLPLAIVQHDSSGNYTSIDQVFNGFGYIGSTVFALPGVKGLIPNGRNADGTLKNTNMLLNKVCMLTLSGGWSSNNQQFTITEDGDIGTNVFTYNEYENYVMYQDEKQKGLIFAQGKITNTKIDNIYFKTAFHALDYNDKSTISGWSMPSSRYINLTLGANGATYTAPANGKIYWRKRASAVNQFIALNKMLEGNTPIEAGVAWSVAANDDIYVNIEVRKSEVFWATYNANGSSTNEFFRFVYAKGEN